MQTLMLTLSAMLICSLVMGRILFWLDNTAFINRISRRLLAFIPWDYEEIKSSFLGLWYYLLPLLFTVLFCATFSHPVFSFLFIHPHYLGFIPLTMLAEISVATLMSGCLTLFSDTCNWSREIGSISWIASIRKRNKMVAPLVPLLAAFVEELFFRGVIFLILYTRFPQLGLLGATAISTALFTAEQMLFTENPRQGLSMLLAPAGMSVVACLATAYTGSLLPALLAHETFLLFYFGRFRYY